MKHYGDISKLHGYDLEFVDAISFGAPCQDLSVAGLRKGMKHTENGDAETTRSGLFFDAIRIIEEMREASERNSGRADCPIRYPRWGIYENVPGAFSSNQGRDFAAVLTALVRVAEPQAPDVPVPSQGWPHSGYLYDEMGRWSVAWTLHDAQFFGVPQRRKRIVVCADFQGLSAGGVVFDPQYEWQTENADACEAFGSSRAERRPEIPTLAQGLQRNTQEGETPWEATPRGAAESLGSTSYTLKIRGGCEGGGKGALVQTELSATLAASQDQTLICLNDQGGAQMDISYEKSGTLRAQEHGHQPIVYSIGAYESNAWKSSNPHSGVYETDVVKALDAKNCGNPACNQGGTAVVEPMVLDMTHADEVIRPCGNTVPTLNARMGTGGNQVPLVSMWDGSQTAPTLTANNANGAQRMPDKENFNCVIEQTHCFQNTGQGWWNESNIGATLRTPCVGDATKANLVSETVGTLCASGYPDKLTHQDLISGLYPAVNSVVRRLTPLECTRLQGFPDGWVNLPPKECMSDEEYAEWDRIRRTAAEIEGKDYKPPKNKAAMLAWYNKLIAAESHQYKALGNSIAVGYANKRGFWMQLIKRISAQYERPITLGSLFDGIGGFPLAWEEYNGKGSARWASEVAEFPIAVTKYHFREE